MKPEGAARPRGCPADDADAGWPCPCPCAWPCPWPCCTAVPLPLPLPGGLSGEASPIGVVPGHSSPVPILVAVVTQAIMTWPHFSCYGASIRAMSSRMPDSLGRKLPSWTPKRPRVSGAACGPVIRRAVQSETMFGDDRVPLSVVV